jgi:alpha-L-fucosidase 2
MRPLASHLWRHYEFGPDKDYLREKAYPIMKETCEFWIDHLITMPDGRLATARWLVRRDGDHGNRL